MESTQFRSQTNLDTEYFSFPFPILRKPIQVQLDTALTSKVPLPFGDTFALRQPTVTGVEPSSVGGGDTFMVTGTGFYPSLVEEVLIDGDSAQFNAVSDTEIDVVAPSGTTGPNLPVVVKTSEGLSNDNVTISIVG